MPSFAGSRRSRSRIRRYITLGSTTARRANRRAVRRRRPGRRGIGRPSRYCCGRARQPLAGRVEYQQIYKTLGLLYSRMGLHAEALEAFRFGRGVNPETAEFYLRIAQEYQAVGNADGAAMAMIEDVEIEGMTPMAVNGL